MDGALPPKGLVGSGELLEFVEPAWRRLVDTYRMPGSAGFSGAPIQPGQRGEPAYHWGFGALLAASGAIARLPGGPAIVAKDLDLLWHACAGYRRWGRFGYSSTSRVGSHFPGDAYFDDNAWVGLAAWELAAIDPRWRKISVDTYRYLLRGQDPRAGGLFWKEHPRAALHVCSTGPAILLGVLLKSADEFPVAEEPLRAMWGWLKSMQAPDGRFWDHQRVTDGVIDRTLWTYNTGTPLHALAVMPGAVDFGGGEEDLCTTFEGVHHFATSDGGLPETPWFNAVLLRGLVAAFQTRGWVSPLVPAYRQVVAEALGRFKDSGDPLTLYPTREPPRLREAAAAVETLARLVHMEMPRDGVVL